MATTVHPSAPATRKAVSPPMPRAIPAGLCASCARASDCRFHWARGSVVMSCNEYELGTSIAALIGEPTSEPQPEAHAAPQVGLCASCSRADECGFVRSEGGVWSCDEYE